MREIHVAADAEFIGGIDTDAAVTLDDFERLQNFKVAAFAPEPPRASLLEHLHKRLGGPVQNGDFDGVNIDVNVVDTAGVDCREQMLGRGQQDAMLHQTRGVADPGYVVALRFDCEIVEVHAAEYDAS